MRTAERIVVDSDVDIDAFKSEPYIKYRDAIKLINIARRELLIECAEQAKSEWVRWGEHYGHQVDQKSITKLIDELK